ncbi:HTH-type transcriptional activator RhaR [Planctomycetes bacterium CA13]|uniref:HTH-type transcriptional activator RhaR n=1 Tax=Novipirellula herctigrandis TaxID=2527986 RepID=A0A5C5ZAJ3_9BACT|nr:HTH-type transcriptional activator RhaR [Planctomycetes bacterium CA13]
MDWTRHDYWKVLLVVDGHGQLLTQTTQGILHRSVVAVVPAGCDHRLSDTEGQPLTLYILCFDSRPPFTSLEGFANDRPTLLTNLRTETSALDTMRHLLLEQVYPSLGSDLRKTGAVCLLLADIANRESAAKSPQAPAPPTATHKVRDYVSNLATTFCRSDTLDTVAHRTGVSRRRFTQLFREITGRAWHPYIQERRVEHAKRLLQSTDRPILAIAFECGFEDASTFYRAFKKVTGESPLAWRQRGSGP